MTEETKALEHLSVIRTLMERATIYRAISSPTALVGGLLSVVVASSSWLSAGPWPFVSSWLVVLVCTLLANTFFVARDSARAGRPLLSSGLRLVLRAILPSIITAGAFSLLSRLDRPSSLAIVWVVFYGLALLAMEQFSPRSLVWLGRIFLVTGLALFLGVYGRISLLQEVRAAHLIMGATFGLFHLIYAAATWPRTSRSSDLPLAE